jgi:hypothetical protein
VSPGSSFLVNRFTFAVSVSMVSPCSSELSDLDLKEGSLYLNDQPLDLVDCPSLAAVVEIELDVGAWVAERIV